MEKKYKTINWEESVKITNNPQITKDLLMMFAKDLPLLEKNIRLAIQTDNRDDLIKILHKLQGSSAYCGIIRLKNMASELEKQLKTDRHSPIDNKLEKIFEEINLVKEELTSLATENYESIQ